jgi:hypothetical protein
MIPYKEIKPFLRHLAWKGVKATGEIIFVFFALVWIAGWPAMTPIMIFGMWWEGEGPLWVMIIAEIFWFGPAAYFAYGYLEEAWENYLLQKGYTKS